MLVRLVACGVMLGLACCSEIALPASEVPGLGDVMPEGGPGAMFDDGASPSARAETWEGSAPIDPSWNQPFLKRRTAQLALQRKQQLTSLIKIQQDAIHTKEQVQQDQLAQQEQLVQQAGERPIDGVPNAESQVYDGYTTQGLEQSDATASCDDAMNAAQPMTLPNTLPPPLLKKLFPGATQPSPSLQALKPIVTFPGQYEAGEEPAQLDVSHTISESFSKDLRTSMDPTDYQHWSLKTSLDPNPVLATTNHLVASSTEGESVVDKATVRALNILKQEYSSSDKEVRNLEGGMNSIVAWGVMNSQAEHVFEGSDVTELEQVTPSPSAAPSHSTPPREVYQEQQAQLVREVEDPSFEEQTLLSHGGSMTEREDAAEPEIQVQQPAVPRAQRSFLGHMPHPHSFDGPRYQADLVGMGRELSTFGAALMAEPAVRMNHTPEMRRKQ